MEYLALETFGMKLRQIKNPRRNLTPRVQELARVSTYSLAIQNVYII
jgi:hypothetical protein